MAVITGLDPRLLLQAGSPGDAAIWRAVLERAAQLQADLRDNLARAIANEVGRRLGA